MMSKSTITTSVMETVRPADREARWPDRQMTRSHHNAK